ncbi:MAG: DMT family transporter [Rhodobacterales bacterium]|nr:DMT family transporter [Rhodobacterales bacterium]
MSDNMRGAMLMMASMAAFTFNDTFVKLLAGQVPLFQVVFIRGVLATLWLALLAWKTGAFNHRISKRDWGFIFWRTAAEIGAVYFFLNALFHMPLANMTAILQSLPLTVPLAAAIFLGEPIGWRRMAAILIGFFGVVLIVRPGTDGFSIYSAYALVAVAMVTLRDISARRLSKETPSLLVSVITSFAIAVFFGVGSITDVWVPLDAQMALMILGASLMIIGGYLFSVMVMRVGEISFIAPFRYTGLIWALLLGWLFFDEWPDTITLIGATIVVASGIFALYRETRVKQHLGK